MKSTTLDAAHQLRYGHFETAGESFDRIQAGLLTSVLDAGNVFAREAALSCELCLAPASSDSNLADPLTEARRDVPFSVGLHLLSMREEVSAARDRLITRMIFPNWKGTSFFLVVFNNSGNIPALPTDKLMREVQLHSSQERPRLGRNGEANEKSSLWRSRPGRAGNWWSDWKARSGSAASRCELLRGSAALPYADVSIAAPNRLRFLLSLGGAAAC